VRLAPQRAVAVRAGRADPAALQARGALALDGDPAALADFPILFTFASRAPHT
jgi:hypothetical protein